MSVEASKHAISVSGNPMKHGFCAWFWRRFRREMVIFSVQTAPMRMESSDRKFSEGAKFNLWHCAGRFALHNASNRVENDVETAKNDPKDAKIACWHPANHSGGHISAHRTTFSTTKGDPRS